MLHLSSYPSSHPSIHPYLLVAGQPSVDSRVDDAIEAHGEGVDVLHLPALALRDQRTQLQVLVLDHLDGVFQRANLHLEGRGSHLLLK